MQAHTHQFLSTFGNPGNGEYRAELRRAVTAIQSYLQAHHHPEERVLLRLDGQYGTGAVLADLAGLPFVMRGKDYQLLKRAEVQARLKLPPDQHLTHPESGMVRTLYDCPDLLLGPEGMWCRLVVATHPAGTTRSRIGVIRSGVVYELFLTKLPQSAFTSSDIVALYLHRGAFENALADEDVEQDPDRWASHAATGQKCWQIVSQWIWNLRLEPGHRLLPDPMRTTEFAPAPPLVPAHTAPSSGYAPLRWASPGKLVVSQGTISHSNQTGRFVVQQTRSFVSKSSAEKSMGAYAWYMRPAFAVVGPVRCANSANGRATPLRSRAR